MARKWEFLERTPDHPCGEPIQSVIVTVNSQGPPGPYISTNLPFSELELLCSGHVANGLKSNAAFIWWTIR